MKQLFMSLCFVVSAAASAECTTSQISGDYSALVNWEDAGTDGFITGILEIRAGGGAVLRGARLTYLDGANLVERVGSAVGRIGVARQCTGFLELSFTDRDSDSEVAIINGNVLISGNQVRPGIGGSAVIDIKNPAPNNVFVRRDLLGQLSIQKSDF